jgi:hypothetical protein
MLTLVVTFLVACIFVIVSSFANTCVRWSSRVLKKKWNNVLYAQICSFLLFLIFLLLSGLPHKRFQPQQKWAELNCTLQECRFAPAINRHNRKLLSSS